MKPEASTAKSNEDVIKGFSSRAIPPIGGRTGRGLSQQDGLRDTVRQALINPQKISSRHKAAADKPPDAKPVHRHGLRACARPGRESRTMPLRCDCPAIPAPQPPASG